MIVASHSNLQVLILSSKTLKICSTAPFYFWASCWVIALATPDPQGKINFLKIGFFIQFL